MRLFFVFMLYNFTSRHRAMPFISDAKVRRWKHTPVKRFTDDCIQFTDFRNSIRSPYTDYGFLYTNYRYYI